MSLHMDLEATDGRIQIVKQVLELELGFRDDLWVVFEEKSLSPFWLVEDVGWYTVHLRFFNWLQTVMYRSNIRYQSESFHGRHVHRLDLHLLYVVCFLCVGVCITFAK